MTHQEELMKDWTSERQIEALSIVSSNLPFYMIYSPEELEALGQSNQDAFDLFAAMTMDIATKQNQSSEPLSEDF